MPNKIDRAIAGNLRLPKGFSTTFKLKELVEGYDVCGLDIEADAKTAQPFLLCYDTKEFNGHIILDNAHKVLELLTHKQFRKTVNFFYNIQYDFEGIMKLFSRDICVLLNGNSEVVLDEDLNICNGDNWKWKILYVNKKAFFIKQKSGKKYAYYDLLQYYSMRLDNAAQEYLGRKKFAFDSSKMSVDRFDTEREYQEEVIRYCKQDSKDCRELGEIIVKGVNKFVNIRKFTSTATISEYYFRSNNLIVPKLPSTVYKKFMKSYYGGRFEITKKGFVNHISMYDIKSAYPFAMATMPILTAHPITKRVTSLHDNALYGSYKINVDIQEDYISSLPKRSHVVYFPVGKFNEYWTDKITLQSLLNRNVNVNIIEGIELYDEDSTEFLNEHILKLFNIKENPNEPKPVRDAAKIILNSLYGKFIQLIDDNTVELVHSLEELEEIPPSKLYQVSGEYWQKIHTNLFKCGKIFAPQYASYITAHTRNILYQTSAKTHFKSLVGFHTDSIILRNKTLEESSKLGGWELEKDKKTKVKFEDSDIQLLKSGMYEVSKGIGKKVRSRGVGNTNSIMKESFDVKRRYGMKQAVQNNRDWSKMNVIVSKTGVEGIKNNVNSDLKRNWLDSLTVHEALMGKMIESNPKVL